MCYSIRLEDLAANALIELLDRKGEKEVSFSTLNKYGSMVVKDLHERNKDAMLLFSRDNTNAFIKNYEKYFLVKDSQEDTIVSLKEGIEIDEIRNFFRGKIAFDVLLALVNEKTIRVLEA